MTEPPLLRSWTIYERPSDYPLHYVVRAFRIMRGEPPIPEPDVYLCDTLALAREQVEALAPDLYRIARSKSDDPTIVETWV
jgi:hypothetical protein